VCFVLATAFVLLPFSNKSRHVHMSAVCINRDFPIAISPVYPRTNCFEACDDIRCRMTKRVPAPAADKRDLGTPGLQQLA